MVALIALAMSLAGLALAFPSEQRWQKLCRTIVAAFGHELVASANAAPPPAHSRKVMALLGLMGLGAVTLVVLIGNFFWTEEVLRRPARPVVRALLLVLLALMMTGFAMLRFARASASRRPLWQRAYGVLLLVFAGYLLLQVAWKV